MVDGGVDIWTKASSMKRSSGYPVFVLPGSGAATGQAERRVSVDTSIPARLEARLRLAECDNPLGPLAVLESHLVLSGLEARVMFRLSGTPADGDRQAMETVTLVPPGERLLRQSHSARGTAGRRPFSLALVDRGGHRLAPAQDIGECVDGITNFDLPFVISVSVVAWVRVRDWWDRHGPLIRVSGELISTRGVNVRLGSCPSEGPMGGTGKGDTEFPLARPGVSFYAREKTLECGISESPWVSVLFMGERGRPIGGEQLVGRCVRG